MTVCYQYSLKYEGVVVYKFWQPSSLVTGKKIELPFYIAEPIVAWKIKIKKESNGN
jgi:hypothetical protein